VDVGVEVGKGRGVGVETTVELGVNVGCVKLPVAVLELTVGARVGSVWEERLQFTVASTNKASANSGKKTFCFLINIIIR
jgi:hypothetical protein